MKINTALSPPDQEDMLEDKLRLSGLVGCYALFQYLTVSIQAATVVYNMARQRMEELYLTLTSGKKLNERANPACTEASHSAADSSHGNGHYISQLAAECEILAVQQAALLRYHSSISVFPLVTLRQTLTKALTSWPSNTLLWSIYVEVFS